MIHTRPPLAIETTVLLHGVPRASAGPLARDLAGDCAGEGAAAAFVALVSGRPLVGLDDADLATLLDAPDVPKANAANLGILIHSRSHAATTVSATLELAAGAGLRFAATGGIGGLHRGLATRLDLSADLGALARHPVALVSSGVKSLLDVEGTRELLESLGVPVVGFRCDRFPAFYRRESSAGLDARFDDERALASFLDFELARSGRGVLVCNPIPASEEIDAADFARWLAEAESLAADRSGREVTPAVLASLHRCSGGRTLRANLALLRSNVRLGARLARLGAE